MSEDHDQLDPAEALMREVGAQLRQVRLERGELLDDVGQHLRIKPVYLLGIEEGDLSTMPGRTYALGFLRSYADYLGFDGDDLITQIKSTVGNLTDKTRLRIRTPMPESRLPKTPILVLSLAAVAGIYAGWSYVNHGSQLVIETVAEVPASLRNLAAGAFGQDDERDPPAAVDVSHARPPRPPAGTGPQGAVARAAPLPTAGSSAGSAGPGATASGLLPGAGLAVPKRTAAPSTGAPASPPSASMTAPRAPAPTPSPSSGTGPPAPPVPATTPEAAPEPPTEAARAYAMARPTAGRDAPDPPASTPAPVEAVPAEAGSPERGAAPMTPAPDAAADAHPGQLAALPFDPAVIGPVGRIEEPDNTDARVVLRALESSWIQISSPGGDYLRARTLEPNDVFLVPNRSDLALWTGNAGGLEVIVDGTVLAPLGTSGAVVRDVPLDPSSLQARLGRPVVR